MTISCIHFSLHNRSKVMLSSWAVSLKPCLWNGNQLLCTFGELRSQKERELTLISVTGKRKNIREQYQRNCS